MFVWGFGGIRKKRDDDAEPTFICNEEPSYEWKQELKAC